MKTVKNESGLTLIEVVASIVIITIVLLSFSQLFIQSNKTAHYNNEKLVLINLADGQLERAQALSFNSDETLNEYISTVNKETVDLNDKKYTIKIEKTKYKVDITEKQQNDDDYDYNLIHLSVTASINNSKSVAEGYVKITKQ